MLGHTFSFFEKPPYCCPQSAPIYIPINIVGGSLFPTSLPTLVICVLSDGRDDQFLLYLMQSGYSSDIAFWSEDSYFYLHPNNSLRVVFCFTLTTAMTLCSQTGEKRKVESKTDLWDILLNCNLKNFCVG